MNGEATVTRIAPYLPFKTFLSAIEALELGLPKKIDKSIWRSQSGLTQGLIMGAFRFFNLVDQEDRPTVSLAVLVEEKENRNALLRQLLEQNYSELLSHDLTNMTPKH